VYAAIASWVVGTSVAGFFWALHIFGTNVFVATGAVELVNARSFRRWSAPGSTAKRRPSRQREESSPRPSRRHHQSDGDLVAAAVTRPRNAPPRDARGRTMALSAPLSDECAEKSAGERQRSSRRSEPERPRTRDHSAEDRPTTRAAIRRSVE
jgi:hypothetical protein